MTAGRRENILGAVLNCFLDSGMASMSGPSAVTRTRFPDGDQ